MERQTSSTTRLNKYLAFRLGVSRRDADSMIASGRITVNGKLAIIGQRVDDNDKVQVDGLAMGGVAPKPTYVLFNKPVGYVSSRRQQGSAPTLYNLLPSSLHHLKTVGRLDKDSSGLLLLSDDGDFILRMTHPKYQKDKIYITTINRPLAPLHQQMISDFGITLDDGTSQMTLERLDDSRTKWQVTMHEGRNRQIRRTFAALGYTVTALHRTNFGKYALDDIKPGEYRII